MSRTQRELLTDAQLHLDAIDDYTLIGLDHDVVRDAIAMRLTALLDALGKLPQETLDDLFGDAWNAMRGMRNRLVHGYHTIDREVVRITVVEELPGVRILIEEQLTKTANR